ncbi:MAG: NAD+ synthase [Planctomycetota bacterium]|nr:NAD+ synthase [Planctomycetota bacterium]
MRVALCQIDTTVGDFDGNVARIIAAAEQAAAAGAALAVFPELAICGYPAEDLLLRDAFLEAHDAAMGALARSAPPGTALLVGCLERNAAAATSGGRGLFNGVALVRDGRVEVVARKCLLPTYDVFDESRYFEPWAAPEQNLVEVLGVTVGVVVCEDSWNDEAFFGRRSYATDPVERVVAAGAQLVVNLSASPWARGRTSLRARMVTAAARRHGVPMIYVNQVGGDVELQFDGGSLAATADGIAAQPVAFAEDVTVVDTAAPWDEQLVEPELVQMQYAACVQGIRAYVQKFGFSKVVLGLSGGIDSALVATLAVDALGAENVTGVGMPSRYSSEHSVEDARALAENLGVAFHLLPIAPLQDAFDATLEPVFAGTDAGLAEENVQSRARGVLLMAYANKHGALLLTTGNKSECAVGYCTIYGDTNGALAPIADLWKTEVWAMARWLNRDGERIPASSIDKPPSAELRPDQLDTDSLPDYAALDPVLRSLVEEERSVEATAAQTGMARDEVERLFRLVQNSEWKRYQYPPTLRLSDRCWRGRRMPVSHRYRER